MKASSESALRGARSFPPFGFPPFGFPTFGLRALHYAALWAFAGAQPLFDLLSAQADFLIAHRLQGMEILALALLVLAVPPALLAIIDLAVTTASRRAGWVVYGLSAGVLGCLFVLQSTKMVREAPAPVALAAVTAILAVIAWSVLRLAPVRSMLSVLAIGVIVFPALFLLRDPVAGMLRPEQKVGAPLGTPDTRIQATTPIVFIVFDELPLVSLLDREKNINRHRFPNFSSFAASSTWYRNASTVAQTTTFAVPAILTGRIPDRMRFANAANHPENLFTWLGGAYRLEVFEGLTRLCPDELCRETRVEVSAGDKIRAAAFDLSAVYLHLVLPRSLAPHLPQIDGTWRDFWSGGRGASAESSPTPEAPEGPKPRKGDIRDQVRRFLDRVARAKSGGRPPLFFLHINIPHVPWRFLPSGKEYGPRNLPLMPHGATTGAWAGSDWETLQGRQRHLLQVGFADQLLGQTRAVLEEAGIWDDSLVVVTADHGVSFRTGQSLRAVDRERPSDVMQVPLFIKTTGQRKGLIRDDNVETVDILPTLATSLGIEPPWAFDGRSLLDPEVPAPTFKSLVVKKGRDAVERLRFPLELAGFDESFESMVDAFGVGEDPQSLLRFGPAPELIGLPVAESPPVGLSRYGVEFAEASELEAVDLKADYLPVHLAGHVFELDEPAASPEARTSVGELDLAVAVNGTVSATTRAHVAATGEIEFTALIPESVLRQGQNQVEFFEVGNRSGAPALLQMTRKGAVRYSLGREESGEVTHLVASDGRRFEIVPDRVAGEVAHVFQEFRGTASSDPAGERVDLVVFFVGDRFVATSRPEGARGRFAFVVPYGLLDSEQNDELRFVALMGDQGSLLSVRAQ